MIKKIKNYFYMRKVQKQIQIEILETLATICSYFEADGRRSHNPNALYMKGHFEALKRYSDILRKEMAGEKIKKEERQGGIDVQKPNRYYYL